MYVAPDNIKDGIANESVLVGAHSKTGPNSKWMCVTPENIKDGTKNE